ncbi:MAG TPA: hypothetical protein PLN94_16670, partial [Thiolinea sp.]|nr:hypothetical protein [Thiolinea sp.]
HPRAATPLATLELRKDAVQRLFYLVRVVSRGRFLVPPPYVEDMYRPDIRGIGESDGIVRTGS